MTKFFKRKNGKGRPSSRGRNRKRKVYKKKSTERKSLSDYIFEYGKAKRNADVKHYLLNHFRIIFDSGNHVATSLEKKQYKIFDKPAMVPPISQDHCTRVKEMELNTIIFEAQVESWLHKQETYKLDMSKAYGYLFGHCSEDLQDKLMSRSDFETKIKDNAIRLLSAIEEYSLKFPEKYPPLVIVEALKTLVNTKQQKDESLDNYTRRFEFNLDNFLDQCGPEIRCHRLAKSYSDWDDANEEAQERCLKAAHDELVTTIFTLGQRKCNKQTCAYGLFRT